MRPPNHYDKLKNLPEREAQESSKEKLGVTSEPKADEKPELEPKRPTHTHPPPLSGGEGADLVSQQKFANDRMKWAREMIAARDASATTHQEAMRQPDKPSGKDLFTADPKETKEGSPKPEPTRELSRSEPLSKKELLAADLKEAKEMTTAQAQSRDTSRGR